VGFGVNIQLFSGPVRTWPCLVAAGMIARSLAFVGICRRESLRCRFSALGCAHGNGRGGCPDFAVTQFRDKRYLHLPFLHQNWPFLQPRNSIISTPTKYLRAQSTRGISLLH